MSTSTLVAEPHRVPVLTARIVKQAVPEPAQLAPGELPTCAAAPLPGNTIVEGA
jgi:hypothetical protein